MNRTKHRSQDEVKKMRRGAYIKIVAAVGFIAAVLAYGTISWFTMNKENNASGMGVKVGGAPFEIKTIGNKGILDDSYLPSGSDGYTKLTSGTTLTSSEDGAKIEWLVDNAYHARNDSSLSETGIRPGDSGVLRFWIIPRDQSTLSVKYTLQLTPYKKNYAVTGGVIDYETEVAPTALTNADTVLMNFINCHILFFGDYDPDTQKYSNLIDDYITENVAFTDADHDGVLDDYEVDIYWVWPETFAEAVLTDTPNRTAICATTSTTDGEGENAVTTYSNELLTKFNSNPGGFLKGYTFPSGTTVLTQEEIAGSYGPMSIQYNNADQDIGDNIKYILAEMTISCDE